MSQHSAAAVRAVDALGSLLRVRMWQAPGSGSGLGRPAAGGALADFAAAARRILLRFAGGPAHRIVGRLAVSKVSLWAVACGHFSVCVD